jgi:RNA polymerase sigma-70 factor (ECF subfamily)
MTNFSGTDEVALITRIAQQDETALSLLYDRYARVLYSVAHKSLGSPEECEEVVLDVFSQVWRIAERYDAQKARASAPLWPRLLIQMGTSVAPVVRMKSSYTSRVSADACS